MGTEIKSDIIAELKAIEEEEKTEIAFVRAKYSSLFRKKYQELIGKRVRITRYSWRGNEKNVVWIKECTVIDAGAGYEDGFFFGVVYNLPGRLLQGREYPQ